MAVAGIAGYFTGGLAVSKAAATSAPAGAASAPESPAAESSGHGESAKESSGHGAKGASKVTGDYAYFDFEPIVVNLDEARLARYIRAAITLAVTQADQKEAANVIERNMPEIRSWLMIKLAGCSLENVRGEKNLTRLCREVADALNARLWPNEKPLIHHVLLKEVAVQ
jgi:flagellar basal body-associated protein FliL